MPCIVWDAIHMGPRMSPARSLLLPGDKMWVPGAAPAYLAIL